VTTAGWTRDLDRLRIKSACDFAHFQPEEALDPAALAALREFEFSSRVANRSWRPEPRPPPAAASAGDVAAWLRRLPTLRSVRLITTGDGDGQPETVALEELESFAGLPLTSLVRAATLR
jgi:hypothetical protein